MQRLSLRRGTKLHGPFSPSKIKQMISTGRIKKTDLLQVEGTDEWIPVGDISSLASGFVESDNDSFETAEETAEETVENDAVADSEDIFDEWEESSDTDEEYEPIGNNLKSQASTLVSDARSKGASLAAEARRRGESPIEASDGLFIVVWKLFIGAREFGYHEPSFPALSACLRIGALAVRVWLVVSLVIAGVAGGMLLNENTLKSPLALANWCSVVGEDPSQYTFGTRFEFSPVSFALGILSLLFWFLIVFGAFEVIRLLITIERNTRE